VQLSPIFGRQLVVNDENFNFCAVRQVRGLIQEQPSVLHLDLACMSRSYRLLNEAAKTALQSLPVVRDAILQVPERETMPTTITLNDRLAERIAVLAAEAGQLVDAFVEHVLQGLVDADIEIRDGIPVFRMPPDAPVLTSADVDRLLHSDLHQ